jgi:YggT family protein
MALIVLLLTAYSWVIIIRALASWVFTDPDHPVMRPLILATEPVLGPLRRLVPPDRLGGLDLSPVIAILLLWVIQNLITGGRAPL